MWVYNSIQILRRGPNFGGAQEGACPQCCYLSTTRAPHAVSSLLRHMPGFKLDIRSAPIEYGSYDGTLYGGGRDPQNSSDLVGGLVYT